MGRTRRARFIGVLGAGTLVMAAAPLAHVDAGALHCFGRRATIVGSQGNDRIIGTRGNDVIVGLGGRDLIFGGFGNDLICGGLDNDHLWGYSGRDKLEGGQGFWDAADFQYSRHGIRADLKRGRVSGEGADVLRGVEAVWGSHHRDVLLGGRGFNALFGFSGSDVLRGGDGGDLLLGMRDDDLLDGGASKDDTASYWLETSYIKANLKTGRADGGSEGEDRLVRIEGLQGGRGSENILIGNDKNNAFFPGLGRGHQYHGDGGRDLLLGGDKADTLHGGDGKDVLRGLGGSDVVAGDAGDDLLMGGSGRDEVIGGSENDLVAGIANADAMDGGDGIDELSYMSWSRGVTLDLSTADDIIAFEVVRGTRFGDVITGDENSNLLVGRDGDDVLKGLDGNDELDGGNGTDDVDGGIGLDRCQNAEKEFGCEPDVPPLPFPLAQGWSTLLEKYASPWEQTFGEWDCQVITLQVGPHYADDNRGCGLNL